eukprot:778170-Prymnesium_polylepis.1
MRRDICEYPRRKPAKSACKIPPHIQPYPRRHSFSFTSPVTVIRSELPRHACRGVHGHHTPNISRRRASRFDPGVRSDLSDSVSRRLRRRR